MRTYLNSMLLFFTLLFAPSVIQAAESITNIPDKESYSFNPVLVGLVSLMIVLLFAIGVMANVLRQLLFVYREKIKVERNRKHEPVKAALLLLVLMIPAFRSIAAETDSTARVITPASGLVDGIPNNDFYLLMSVIGLELFVLFSLVYYIHVLVRIISCKPELAPIAKAIARRPFLDRLNKAVAIEKEKDILLDHDYDGIRELDNSLPPWWKYGFYLTIVVAVIYLYRYHISDIGPNPQQEFAAEMQQAEEDKAAYLAKSANNVDENTVTLLTDASDLASGQQVFENTCFACHAKDGGGGVGPNLTDDYWLHGGSIKDVFKSIKYGWQDKGMKSWKDDFSPKQIAQIASYVKSLHGTKPVNPKDKQGELYIDGNDPAKKVDSNSSDKVVKD